MSFTWQGNKLYTYEAGAKTIIDVGLSMGISPKGIVMAIACVRVESDFWVPGNLKDPCYKANPNGYRHDSESNDGLSSGWYQQQMSTPGAPGQPWGWGGLYGDPEGTRKRMDPVESTKLFFNALKGQRVGNQDYNSNAKSPGIWVADVQKCAPAYRGRYDEEWAWAQALYDRVKDGGYVPTPPAAQVPVAFRPTFTEIDMMTGGGRSNRSRKPINFFIHTEEGNSTAEQLARYCDGSHNVSYHYTLRDGKLADVVDTDYASWSVLDANVFSINLCFAGSRAAMTRDEWLARENDIEIAAFIAVQDCQKYGMSTEVLVPRWALSGSEVYAGGPRGGISDHNYVTRELGIGDHHDVGPNFPWDRFAFYVNKYTGVATGVEDFMSALNDAEQKELLDKTRQLWGALFNPVPDTSIFGNPTQKLPNKDRLTYMDGNVWDDHVKTMAVDAHQDWAIESVVRAAAGKGPLGDTAWVKSYASDLIKQIPKDVLDTWMANN